MKKSLLLLLAIGALSSYGAPPDKLTGLLPLKENLQMRNADGSGSALAVFRRPGTALDDKFQVVAADTPRFSGGGLLIENGGRSFERGAWNFLPAAGLWDGSVTPCDGVYGKGIKFSGKLNMKPQTLRTDRHHVLSFFARGSGELQLAGTMIAADGREKALPAQKFQLTGEWKRFYLPFHAGSVKEPFAAKTVKFTFAAPVLAELSAWQLAGPCVYFQAISPGSFVPYDSFRQADSLKLPVVTPELGLRGALAFDFTPTAQGWWHALLSIGGSWKPELELSYMTNDRLQCKFRGKTLTVLFKMKLHKKYHIILNYDRDSCTLFIDGRKIGAMQAPGAPFKEKELFIGSRNIEIRADGVFANVAIFHTELTAAEIAELTADPAMLKTLAAKRLTVTTPFRVFPANNGPATLRLDATADIAQCDAAIDGMDIVAADVKKKL